MKKIIIFIFISLNTFLFCEETVNVQINSNVKNINVVINDLNDNNITSITYENEMEIELTKSKKYKIIVEKEGY